VTAYADEKDHLGGWHYFAPVETCWLCQQASRNKRLRQTTPPSNAKKEQ
jgi:hypothetical protein